MTSYHQAGIDDVAAFYQDKFAFEADHDFTPRLIHFHSLYYFKRVWIYAQVRPESKVLDVGCGSGAMACLKRKGCQLYGVDFSAKALAIAAGRNGYDATFCGDILDCDFELASFDYVVSVDVFGHIPFQAKNAVIERLKAFLVPGGVMLHGIECAAIDYEAMSSEELARFVAVDGHVGMEDRRANLERFGRFFPHVEAAVRYDVIKNAEDYPKQHGAYGKTLTQPLAAYLATLGPFDREVFDVAAGIATVNLQREKIGGEGVGEGFLLLAASDVPLPPPDWAFPTANPPALDAPLLPDDQVFLRGFYPVESDGETLYRWSTREGYIYLQGHAGARLKLSLYSHYPRIGEAPVEVFVVQATDNAVLHHLILYSPQPVEVAVDIPSTATDYLLKLYSTTTWVPCYSQGGDDGRELGVGVKWVYLVPRDGGHGG